MLKGNVKRLYLSQYPKFSLEEIEAEIISFEKTAFDLLGMQESSANRHKYLRGWLLRAHSEKEKYTTLARLDLKEAEGAIQAIENQGNSSS